MTKYIPLIAMLVAVWGPASGQLLPNLGGQRVGISGLSFLKNDLSPRSVGMGGAHVTLSGDAYSIATNPAALSATRQLTIGVSNLYYANGLNHSLLAATLPLGTNDNLTLSLNSLNGGAQEVRTEFQPGGTGQYFYATNLAVGLGYSRRLSDMFSFGGNIKYVLEQLDVYKAQTVAVDLGFLYRTDFKDLRFGAALYNFGNNSTLKGEGRPVVYNRTGSPEVDDFPLPTLFKMGASIKALDRDDFDLLAIAQLNHPNDNAENIRLGGELQYRDYLFLRLGMRLNVEGERLPTAGLGARLALGLHTLTFDYAFAPSDYLGMWHSAGLSFSLHKDTAEQNPATR